MATPIGSIAAGFKYVCDYLHCLDQELRNCYSDSMEWGVVVAADNRAEWLLPWWWKWYSKHQKQRVAFVDLGLSKAAQKWCQERGVWIRFEGAQDFAAPKDQISCQNQKRWEALYGTSVWNARKSWFKKPLAMLHSPFQKSVWLDLDCEVCQPIDSILEGIGEGMLGAVRVEKSGHYNSGVIAYDNESPLLKAWAEACLKDHASSIGDETLLSCLIRKKHHPFQELPPVYNWMMGWGYHPELKIAHWAASWGKLCIETMGGIQGYCEEIIEAVRVDFQ